MIKAKELPSADYLKSIFEYRDGKLYHAKSGSGVTVGNLAGNYNQRYVSVKIKQSAYKLHRVIFMMHHGYCPETIDHINGNSLDNRKLNLRICTNSQNLMNRGKNKNNTSGYKGVRLINSNKKWRAQIQYKKIFYHLGCFEKRIDAAKAYNEAAIKFHGEFANLNKIV